ncbi:MarR family winged helix-turn-helix transcriptional regulator [Blastococcus montanus]|uniref:MarR family winged helix-turn-helix transcriptional regulator n=1 Tax=Blastococcus montanus TaxID=3144973 RepID=UPI00320806FC
MTRVSNRALAEVGLKARSYAALALATDLPGGITQRELSISLGLDPSQVVGLVDVLAATRLVERRTSPTDRRTNLVVPTREGQRLRERAAGLIDRAQADLLGHLDDDEAADLRRLMNKLAGSTVTGLIARSG